MIEQRPIIKSLVNEGSKPSEIYRIPMYTEKHVVELKKKKKKKKFTSQLNISLATISQSWKENP